MTADEEARQRVADLVSRFAALGDRGRQRLNERQAGTSFIEPLFEALGWSVRDPGEVSVEVTIARQRVDYAFRLHGVTQFIVEAKAPHRNLDDPEFKKQAVTYAYNKGVNWAVLTNFRDLRVFSVDEERLFLNLSAQDYVGSFEKLWLLSKLSWRSGLFEREARQYGALRPRVPVEESLFAQLRQWRETLFNQIAQYNDSLTNSQIDELIQQLLNRLIFIRTAEDRGIEEHSLLAALHQWEGRTLQGNLLDHLRSIFQDFSHKYDSDLFPLMDQWGSVHVDHQVLEPIYRGLYERPQSLAGYNFNDMPPDVLGSVYEQYLGYVARAARERAIQRERQARFVGLEPPRIELEARRERRKAQGIYYTPRWVVDYIVRQTVGRFVAERSHDEIINVKILDPACGSGSFLIRAYEELLAYHARVQGKTPSELGWAERIGDLTRNIFGVDLDDQAIQIARLNLLLSALAKQELLPSLAHNIRRGNSLISGDEEALRPYFGDGWLNKRPFDWEREFPDIMASGGFDVIIGNPPYVRIQSLDRREADFFRSRFESAYGSFDVSVLFVEEALRLLRPGGRLGFITTGKFLKTEYGQRLQQYLLKEATVETVVDLSGLRVFGDATTYPAIIVVQQGARSAPLHYLWAGDDSDSTPTLDTLPVVEVEQQAIVEGVWPPAHGATRALMRKMERQSDPLGSLAKNVFQGLITSADAIYHLQLVSRQPDGGVLVRTSGGEQRVLEPDLLRPLVAGKNIDRYVVTDTGDLLLFPYRLTQERAALVPSDEVERAYPATWRYLCDHEAELRGRERGKMDHDRWYAYVYPKSLGLHDSRKLAVPRLVHRLEAYYDASGHYYLDNVDVGGIILGDDSEAHYLFVLGLLNSRLLDWYFQRKSAPFRGGFRSANRQYLEPLPIRHIAPGNPSDRETSDQLVALVQRMLGLHQRKADASLTQSEREDLQREIARTDQEIDSVVYDLYGLTEEERQLIEQSATAPAGAQAYADV